MRTGATTGRSEPSPSSAVRVRGWSSREGVGRQRQLERRVLGDRLWVDGPRLPRARPGWAAGPGPPRRRPSSRGCRWRPRHRRDRDPPTTWVRRRIAVAPRPCRRGARPSTWPCPRRSRAQAVVVPTPTDTKVPAGGVAWPASLAPQQASAAVGRDGAGGAARGREREERAGGRCRLAGVVGAPAGEACHRPRWRSRRHRPPRPAGRRPRVAWSDRHHRCPSRRGCRRPRCRMRSASLTATWRSGTEGGAPSMAGPQQPVVPSTPTAQLACSPRLTWRHAPVGGVAWPASSAPQQ